MSIRDRLKSKAVWISLAGALGLVLEALGVFERLGIDREGWSAAIGLICAALTAFGILNNPTDREAF